MGKRGSEGGNGREKGKEEREKGKEGGEREHWRGGG